MLTIIITIIIIVVMIKFSFFFPRNAKTNINRYLYKYFIVNYCLMYLSIKTPCIYIYYIQLYIYARVCVRVCKYGCIIYIYVCVYIQRISMFSAPKIFMIFPFML